MNRGVRYRSLDKFLRMLLDYHFKRMLCGSNGNCSGGNGWQGNVSRCRVSTWVGVKLDLDVQGPWCWCPAILAPGMIVIRQGMPLFWAIPCSMTQLTAVKAFVVSSFSSFFLSQFCPGACSWLRTDGSKCWWRWQAIQGQLCFSWHLHCPRTQIHGSRVCMGLGILRVVGR